MNATEMTLAITTLTARIVALETALAAQPVKETRAETTMTEEHAFRVKFGDMKDTKHKAAADALKLSYGQIFSCRGGYTFKQVKADWKPKASELVGPPAPVAPATETA